ncbi:MAG: AbrB/MazE/SpoVT family DNA-binding domain-containing protein [Deltaproteobacteria bacterium]|nr:AbrB/MazE/SpoVT family DNA-binding domain-containing protein [Deltaproteobacteria bacterium]
MLMKVFNKGQVVIPAAVRKEFGIEIGDMLDVVIDRNEKSVKLKRPEQMTSRSLAGSLSRYNRRKRFPTRAETRKALAEGLANES